MTLREIIYDVLETLNAYSDDITISEEQIAFIVNNKRNMLLKQYMSNLRKEIPFEAIQNICLPLAADESCFDDITVLKSTSKVPGTLDNTGRSSIIKAYGGTRFQKNINVIDYSRIPFVASEPYTGKQLYVAIDPKSYLVVFNSDNGHLLLEQMEIEGVFENPEAAYAFDCESNDNCEFFDATYPIESALVDAIKMQVVQELLYKYKVPMDNTNNAEQDINAVQK